jgi:hypothetical protein
MSDVHDENANSSISWSFDWDSNATFQRELQLEKHDLPILSTEAGIQIERNE